MGVILLKHLIFFLFTDVPVDRPGKWVTINNKLKIVT